MPHDRLSTRDHSRPHSDHSQVGLEVSNTVLKALEKVARASPVPGLAEAAGLVLQITETAEKVKFNEKGFSRLADDAAELVYVIFCTQKDIARAEDVDSSLKENLDEVLKALLDIQELTNKGAERGTLAGLWHVTDDADKITEYRERLQQCLRKFGFQSDVTIRLMVIKLAAQHDKMMEMLDNRLNQAQHTDGVSRPEVDAVRDDGALITSRSAHVGDRTPVHQSAATQRPGTPATSNVSFGDGANFAGAMGVAMGTNNVVNTPGH